MKVLFLPFVLLFSVFFVVHGTNNVCIPLHSEDLEVVDTSELLDEIKSNISGTLSDKYKEPLPIDHIDVDITHPAVSLKGVLDNVSIYHLEDYYLCLIDVDITNNKFSLFNLTFMDITAKGTYNLTGDLGDLFDIFGDGNFWLNFQNLSFAVDLFNLSTTEDEKCFPINIDLDIAQVKMHFYHSMDDLEMEHLISKGFGIIAPESLRILWSELKDIFDKPIKDAVNNFFHHRSVQSVLRKTVAKSIDVKKDILPFCFYGSKNDI